MITQISPQNSGVIAADGTALVALPACPPAVRQRLNLVNVSCAGTTAIPTATVYRGSTSGPLEQVDFAQNGVAASSGKVAATPFFSGQVLWVKWVGGTPGATVSIQAYGEQRTRSDPPFDAAPIGEGFPLVPSELLVGAPGSGAAGGVYIGPNLPAPLFSAYHLLLATISDFSILMFPNGTDYWYQIVGTNSAPVAGVDIWAAGWVRQGVVKEFFRVEDNGPTFFSNMLFGHSAFADDIGIQYSFGLAHAVATDSFHFFKGNTTIDAGGTWSLSSPATFHAAATFDADLDASAATSMEIPFAGTVNGVPIGAGVLDGVNVTTTGALTAGVSAETDIPNLQLTASVVAGRTYRIFATVLLTLSVNTDQWRLNARTTTAVTGTKIGEADGIGSATAAIDIIYQATATASVTFFISFNRQAGTGVITPFGSPGGTTVRTYSYIEDISPTASWRTS